MKDIGRTVFNAVNVSHIFPSTIKSRFSHNEDGELLCNTEMKQQPLGLQVQPVADPYLHLHASLPAFLPGMYLSTDAFEQYFLYLTLCPSAHVRFCVFHLWQTNLSSSFKARKRLFNIQDVQRKGISCICDFLCVASINIQILVF